MESILKNSRMFNDKDGWYIYMRVTDEKNLNDSKHKLVAGQHLMGPYKSKNEAEEWLEDYLSKYGENRNADEYIPDTIAKDE